MNPDPSRVEHPKPDFAAIERKITTLRRRAIVLGAISFVVLAPLGTNTGKGGRELIEVPPTFSLIFNVAGFLALGCGFAALYNAYRAHELGSLLPRPKARREAKR